MAIDFAALRGALFDMDGVLYRNNLVLPGARELLAWLEARGMPYACVTNNASQLPEQYAVRLRAMGILVSPERILTSSMVANAYLRARAPAGTRVFAVGMDGLLGLLFGDSYFVLDEDAPQYVVVGADFDLTYAKLRTACFAIRKGATFIGTNPDLTFPTEQGLAPGAGSIIVALQAATGVTPVIMGKPQPPLFEAALQLLGTPAPATLMVGDSLVTDLPGAQTLGLPTVLLLSGVTTAEELANSSLQPDASFADLAALFAQWRAAVT